MPPKRAAAEGASRRRVRARSSPAAALPFVEFQDGRFSVNPEAVAFLQGLGDQKLAVATVAGPYRHGKSFLLKRVILEQTGPGGFQVGNTVNACTKGLQQPITERQYLEGALQPIEGGDPEKEQVRACLQRFFRHRDCATLPPPGAGRAACCGAPRLRRRSRSC